jgi:elongation factor G
MMNGVKVRPKSAGFLDDFKLPRAIFINKLDRERADFSAPSKTRKCSSQAHHPPAADRRRGGVQGVVDLIAQKAHIYGADTAAKASGRQNEDSLRPNARPLTNIAKPTTSVERYLEGETLSEEDLRTPCAGILPGRLPQDVWLVPRNIGIDLLMDFTVATPSLLDEGRKTGKDPATRKEIERLPDPKAPFSALVVKTITDPYAGRLTIFRVFSGTIGADGSFYNSKKEVRERYNQLLVILGKEQKPVEGAGPGSIVAVAKLKETATGDTLCDEANKILFTPVEPIPTLISYALSAKTKGDEDKVFTSLTRLLEEDTSLRIDRLAETKIILHGQADHIETTVEHLKRSSTSKSSSTSPRCLTARLSKSGSRPARNRPAAMASSATAGFSSNRSPAARVQHVDAIGRLHPRQYICR